MEFEVHGGIDAPASARDASLTRVRETDERLAEAVAGDLRLLVSELVANAVLHGGARDGNPVGIAIDVDDARAVRVAVTDPGVRFSLGSQRDAGGWGLQLVESVASSWGLERRPGATTVWFELERESR